MCDYDHFCSIYCYCYYDSCTCLLLTFIIMWCRFYGAHRFNYRIYLGYNYCDGIMPFLF